MCVLSKKMAHKDSIKIYTIGIGEATGSNDGLDELTLKEVSKIADGEYFLAEDPEMKTSLFSVRKVLSMNGSQSCAS